MIKRDLTQAAEMVAADNSWYTVDQVATQLKGTYRFSTELRFEYVRNLLRSMDSGGGLTGKTLVDLGCGDGVWSILIGRDFACSLVGVDYNELRLSRYSANVPGAEARLGSCYEIPLDDGAADIVLFNQVLEHLEQPAKALSEIRRVLSPTGRLIISVPNEGTWLKQRIQYRYIEPRYLKTTDHVQFFTAKSLGSLLEACGFEVERLDLMGFYFPHNGISRRLSARRPIYQLGLLLARLFPVLHDCIFATARVSGPK